VPQAPQLALTGFPRMDFRAVRIGPPWDPRTTTIKLGIAAFYASPMSLAPFTLARPEPTYQVRTARLSKDQAGAWSGVAGTVSLNSRLTRMGLSTRCRTALWRSA